MVGQPIWCWGKPGSANTWLNEAGMTYTVAAVCDCYNNLRLYLTDPSPTKILGYLTEMEWRCGGLFGEANFKFSHQPKGSENVLGVHVFEGVPIQPPSAVTPGNFDWNRVTFLIQHGHISYELLCWIGRWTVNVSKSYRWWKVLYEAQTLQSMSWSGHIRFTIVWVGMFHALLSMGCWYTNRYLSI